MSSPAVPLLGLGEQFSPNPEPLRKPSSSSPHILVIGGGVTGLTTSWLLMDKGYRVTVVSKEWASYTKSQRLTSQIAAALWEYPSAGCGPETSPEKLRKLRDWALQSYNVYCGLVEQPEVSERMGLKLRPLYSFFPYPIETNEIEHERMLECRGLRGFRHDRRIIDDLKINKSSGVVDVFEHLSPCIDTDHGMEFLMDLMRTKGATLVADTIYGDLLEQEEKLLTKYQADILVNATGLSSRELARDPTLSSARGAVLRVINDGTDFERISHAIVVATDIPDNYNLIFIVPRNDDTLVLGAITELDEWQTDLTVNSPIVQKMRQQCDEFVPALKKARLDPDYPLAQGLRPLRKEEVRVEREQRKHGSKASRIVHVYGHSVAGWTLAFGTAAECVRLVEQVAKSEPRPRL
ncbi:MAG: hypothetical protein Q9223_005135 [Gallowayella weberi]